MKLIIDRKSTITDFYTVDFGPDFDIFIGSWKIPTNLISPEALAEADRIITKSVELKWCVMYIKHPLLQKSYTDETQSFSTKFFINSDETFLKKPLREYFALRLFHRRFPCELIEIGRRLFKDC